MQWLLASFWPGPRHVVLSCCSAGAAWRAREELMASNKPCSPDTKLLGSFLRMHTHAQATGSRLCKLHKSNPAGKLAVLAISVA